MDGRYLSIQAALWLSLSFCASTGAFTYNVNPDGSGDFTAIRPAMAVSADGDTIIVAVGRYIENINLLGRAIHLRSSDPNNPDIVANTIIDGSDPGGSDCIYDLNPDKYNGINIYDYIIFASAWGTQSGDPGWNDAADFDNDGVVNISDYIWFAMNWGKSIDDPSLVYPPGMEPADVTSVILLENGEGPDTIIDGFTITGGNYDYGAGVLCNGASCTIRNCVITANTSPNRGGAIYCQNGTALYITNCSITDNSAVDMGGGIYATNTAITITGSTFSDNAGGALYLQNGSEATISDSVFDQNSSSGHSGGITCYNSQIKIEVSRFTGNISSDDYGGAIYLSNSGGYLRSCTITGNRGKKGGGIYCISSSSPEITNCVLAGNYASETGTPGGGLHCLTSSNPTVRNSIFWLNRPTQVTSFAAPTIKYCLLQGGWGTAADHNLDADPVNPLKPKPDFLLEGYWHDNGTPANTSDDYWVEVEDFANPAAYHLDVYSPCVDTGDPAFIPELDQADIDGHPRFMGLHVDMGIDETLDSAGNQQRVHNVTKNIWYETIQAALNDAAAADELLANPGRYTENINFNGKAVTLAGRYNENAAFIDATAIDGSDQSASVVIFENSEGADSIIEGFTITNGNSIDGGGIYCDGSSPAIRHCTITNNSSGNGGGIGVYNGQPTISHCVIKNNNASNNGGALALSGNSILAVHNCAMVANTADVSGGGIYCDAVAAGGTVKFCTIKDNTSYGLYSDGTGQITLENTILWNNQPEQLPEPVQIYASNPAGLTINYCDIQNGWLGDGNIDIDPNFYTYQDDSDTQVEHDYKFYNDSPCINTGDPDYVNDNQEKDIYGSNRLAYCRADIGAYEPATLSTTGLAGVVNNNTQKTWYCKIQDALDKAVAGNEIIVSTGRYNENIIISRKITLRGTSPSDPNTIDDTIISGVLESVSDPQLPYASTVSLATTLAAGTTVKGLTITNGIGYLDNNNTPNDPDDDFLKGGGLFSAYNNDVSIINCNITTNTADLGGGIALQNCNKAIVAGCRVMNNVCTGDQSNGGGIFIMDCDDAAIGSSIIADNTTTGNGGGIYAASSNKLALNFCTIADNTAGQSVGGLELVLCQATTVNNSILWANSPDQITAIFSPELSVNYCDIQNGWSGGGANNISADPRFVHPDNGNYHLSDTSACFNAGNPGYVYTSGSDFDIDGQARLAYCRIDIGADEAADVEFKYLRNLVRLTHTTSTGTTTKWYTTIQAALNNAADNDQVMVTQGKYVENVTINRKGLTLTGVAPDEPVTVTSTTIDGSNPSDPNAATVVTLKTALADDATVTGLTLTGGSGTRGSDEIFRGGGLLSIDNDRVTISNCHIIDNTAGMGGGIYLSGQYSQSDPAVSCLIGGCNISGNKATQRGGAAELYYCTDLTLSHNVITGNSQPDGTISASYISDAAINHCTIADNQAGTSGSGGGLKLWEVCYDVAIANSIFWGNTPDQIVNDGAVPPPAVTHSDVQGSYTGTGNINLGPLFAEPGTWDSNLWLPGDYHLKSEFGRWMPFANRSDIITDGIVNMYDFVALSQQWQQSGDDLSADINLDGTVNLADLSILEEGFLTTGAESSIGVWATDDSTSPCIDAGDPADDYSLEPIPNGNRVNMGAYGATTQASRSPEPE